MIRLGNCLDNAVAESFLRLLKRERVKDKIYPTREDARRDVFNTAHAARVPPEWPLANHRRGAAALGNPSLWSRDAADLRKHTRKPGEGAGRVSNLCCYSRRPKDPADGVERKGHQAQ